MGHQGTPDNNFHHYTHLKLAWHATPSRGPRLSWISTYEKLMSFKVTSLIIKIIRLWQPEFPFLIRWTSKNLAALPKEKNDGPEKKRSQK